MCSTKHLDYKGFFLSLQTVTNEIYMPQTFIPPTPQKKKKPPLLTQGER